VGITSDDFRIHSARKGRRIGFNGEDAMNFGQADSAHNGDGIGAGRLQLSDLADKKMRLALTSGEPISSVSARTAATRCERG
jgi:hypothetical protein